MRKRVAEMEMSLTPLFFVIRSADLLANDTSKEVRPEVEQSTLWDTLGGILGRVLTLTSISNFRQGTGFLDANGFIHFNLEPKYAWIDPRFEYGIAANEGRWVWVA